MSRMERLPEEDDGWEVVPRPNPRERERRGGGGFFEFRVRVGRAREEQEVSTSAGALDPTKRRGEDQQRQSLLFSLLPAELRILIYDAVFRVPGETGVRMTREQKPTPSVLALLQTCRKVLREAEGVFYSINRLTFCPYPSIAPRALNSARATSITKLRVPVSTPGEVLQALQKLRNLGVTSIESLWIDVGLSIRFVDLRVWRVMRPSIQRVLGEFAKLEDFRVGLARVNGALTRAEEGKLREWEAVVERLKGEGEEVRGSKRGCGRGPRGFGRGL